MHPIAIPPSATTSERARIAAILLILQGGLSAVTAIGQWAYLHYARQALQAGQLLPLLLPLLCLLLGLGVAAAIGWARRAAIGLEATALAATLLTHLLPGATLTLVTLLVTLLLPAAVMWLLLARAGGDPPAEVRSGGTVY